MKLFLSGPMTGLPELNRPAFDRVAARLRELGHDVWNPARDVRECSTYRAAMKQDLDWMCTHAEGIVSLPGWFDSPGALVEAALGCAIGIPQWEAVEDGDDLRFAPAAGEGNPAAGMAL